MLAALHGYRHRVVSSRLLAEQACQIEIDVLGKPIGRQDQYAAAFGGLNYIRFNPDDTVDVEPVPCRPETMVELERQILLVYTGQTRDANPILERQSGATADRMDVLRSMRDLAHQMRDALAGEGDLDRFAALLHEGWELKRSLGCGISNDQINEWYDGGAPGRCRWRQAPGSRRRRLPAAGCTTLAASGDPRGLGTTPRAAVPNRQAWQPADLRPQLKSFPDTA